MNDARAPALLAIVLLGLFWLDAVLIRSGATGALDAAVLHLRNARPPTLCDGPGIAAVVAGGARAGWPDAILLGITLLGEGMTRAGLTIVAAIALIVSRRPRLAGLLVGAMILETIGETATKRLFARPRPDVIWWHACWLSRHLRWSFPSGHAAGSMTLYPVLGLVIGTIRGQTLRWIGTGLLLSIAIGSSRALLGVHWASDVIGGWLLGGASLCVAVAVANRFRAGARRAR